MPGWIIRLIDRIGDSAEFGICAIASPLAARHRKRDNVLFRLIYRLELLAGAGKISSGGAPAIDTPRIALNDEDVIRAQAPDLILDLSGNHGVGISTAAARHGVWFTDATGSVPGIAGLRPLLEGLPVSSINLFRRSEAFAMPECIATAAVNIKFVASRNESFLEEKSVTLILRELKRLALGMRI